MGMYAKQIEYNEAFEKIFNNIGVQPDACVMLTHNLYRPQLVI